MERGGLTYDLGLRDFADDAQSVANRGRQDAREIITQSMSE